MPAYQTKQRAALIAFFQKHAGTAYTVDALTAGFAAENSETTLPRSTAYRLIAKLETEGLLRRLAINEHQSAYQYFDPAKCRSHLHMRCEYCGQVFHLSNDLSHGIETMLASNAGVSLDITNTILLGECEKCRRG